MKSLNTELKLTDEIQNSINAILRIPVPDERKKVLEPLVSYIKNKIELGFKNTQNYDHKKNCLSYYNLIKKYI